MGTRGEGRFAGGALGAAALAVGMALGGAPAARADTIIEKGTYDSDTWTPAGSPYRVHGATQYSSLTIEAGTTVLMADRIGTPIYASQSFTVRGTPTNPVTFDAEAPTGSPSWGAIIGQGTVSVTGVIVRNATIGFQLDDDVSVQYARFEHCEMGMSSTRGNVRVDAVYAIDNAIGLENVGAQTFAITSSVFSGNTSYAFEAGTYRTSSVTTIDSSTFVQNGWAVDVSISLGSGATITMRNSIVAGNRYGVDVQGSTPVAFTVIASDFWMNQNDYTVVGAPTLPCSAGCLAADPKLVSDTDFHLLPTSPCIDTGTAQGAPADDADLLPRHKGAGFDMGAFEYDPAGGSGGAGGSSGGSGGGSGSPGGGSPGGAGGVGAGASGGGGAGAGGSSGGAGDAGPAGGAGQSAGAAGAGGTGPTRTNDGGNGCGCRSGSATPSADLPALLLALSLASISALARSRRCRARSPR
jgi:uncharacterized membrane protein YgcG